MYVSVVQQYERIVWVCGGEDGDAHCDYFIWCSLSCSRYPVVEG